MVGTSLMSESFKVVKCREIEHGVVELRSDNILVFRPDIHRFKEYDLEILKELLVVFLEITEGVPRPYLCDNSFVPGMIGRREQKYISETIEQFASSCAMITRSSFIRAVLNGFNAIFKPNINIRIFNTEEEAVNWLLQQ